MRLIRVACTLLVIEGIIVSAYWGPKSSKKEAIHTALTEDEKVVAPARALLSSAPEPDHQIGLRSGTQPVQWPEVKPLPKTRAANAIPKHAATKSVAVHKLQTGYVNIGGRPL
jgi:hypothetical protein